MARQTLGIVGSGYIGSTVARLAVNAGLDVVISNSRGPDSLSELVTELGHGARGNRGRGGARRAIGSSSRSPSSSVA